MSYWTRGVDGVTADMIYWTFCDSFQINFNLGCLVTNFMESLDFKDPVGFNWMLDKIFMFSSRFSKFSSYKKEVGYLYERFSVNNVEFHEKSIIHFYFQQKHLPVITNHFYL